MTPLLTLFLNRLDQSLFVTEVEIDKGINEVAIMYEVDKYFSDLDDSPNYDGLFIRIYVTDKVIFVTWASQKDGFVDEIDINLKLKTEQAAFSDIYSWVEMTREKCENL